MSTHLAPRLHGDRRVLVFWAGACLIAFALAFALGTVWTNKRTHQDQWARYEAPR